MKRHEVDVKNSNDAVRGDYTEVLKKIASEDICPFCEENLLIHHKKPILFKNKGWIVTTNAWPYAGTKHHFLFITRKHFESAEKATANTWKDLQLAFKKVCKLYGLKGASLVMRSGDTSFTGATVRHLHAQVMVGQKRKTGDVPIMAVVGYKRP
jgi:ATP adenylyltransferase